MLINAGNIPLNITDVFLKNQLQQPIVVVLLKYASESTHTEEEWQALKAFYNFKCLRCGAQEPDIKLTRDHVIPLTQGGSDSIDNVQPLCARCNSKKNNKHIDYR